MAIISLKSQYVSLIFTVANTLAEIALLGALFVINTFVECKRLLNGHHLSIRSHTRRRAISSIVALTVFLIIEVLTSFLSDPTRIPIKKVAPCVKVDHFTKIKGSLLDFNESITILLNCIKAKRGLTSQAAGRLRHSDGMVQCDSPLFSYMSPGIEITTLNNFSYVCNDRLCCGVRYRPSFVYFTKPFPVGPIPPLLPKNTKIKTLVTNVGNFNATPFLQEIASRLLEVYQGNFSSSSQQRNLVFLGAKNTSCEFDELIDGVTIPTAMLTLVIILWSLSLTSFVATLPLMRSVFYDMSKPLHWATRTVLPLDPTEESDAIVATEVGRGKHNIYLLNAARSNS